MTKRIFISPEKMLSAKKSNDALLEILNLSAYHLHFVANQIYKYYNGELDRSVTEDDIYSLLQMNVINSIKSYYIPSKYNPKLDGYSENYKNGFNYITYISKRFMRTYLNLRLSRRNENGDINSDMSSDDGVDPNVAIEDTLISIAKEHDFIGDFFDYILKTPHGIKEYIKLRKLNCKLLAKTIFSSPFTKIPISKLSDPNTKMCP